MKNIQYILDLLRSNKISEEVDKPHYMIREGYNLPRYKAEDYDDCCNIIIHYYQYHFRAWMKSSTTMPRDIAFGQAKQMLDKGQGGFIKHVKNAIWGRESGLIGLIDTIADTLREDSVAKYVDYVLSTHVNPMDFDLKVHFMKQYLKQYAIPVLPGERLMSAYELASNFDAVIKYHLQWINSLRTNIQ